MALAKATGLIVGIGVKKLEFRLRDVRDETGTLVSLRIFYWDKMEFREHLTAEPAFQILTNSGLIHDRMHTYLTKAATGGEPGNRGTIAHAMFIVRLCAWKMAQEQRGVSIPILFLERIAWFDSLCRYAVSHGVSVIPIQSPLRLRSVLRRSLPPKAKELLSLIRYRRFTTIKRNLMRRQPSILQNSGFNGTQAIQNVYSTDQTASDPMVAIEAVGHPNLDRQELQSDFFFWQQSSLPGSNILATFSIPYAPLNEQGWTDFRKHEISAIALHPAATTVPSARVFTPNHPNKQSLKVHFHASGHRAEEMWIREQISNYRQINDYWKDLCSQFNVKVFVTQGKYDGVHCAISAALRSEGGIAAVYQRAFESQPAVGTTIDADIVFGFSPIVASVERLSGSEIPYHVATGYPADYRFPLLREDANSLRKRLQRNGAEHIIAFFDENSMGDDRWHTGHRYTQENYHFLLKKVLDDPWFGLVIKPKIPRTLRSRLGPVAEILKQAEATDRCFVFDDDALRGIYTPAAAALAADVAVHSDLSATTAALEAALAGVPSLLLDRDGGSGSPLYRLKDHPVVFSNLEELWESCRLHWFNQTETPGFGDWSPMLDEFDPFRDGRAAERMGTYLHWLIEGFRNGHHREEIMADAAQRYCDLWGNDKISQVKR